MPKSLQSRYNSSFIQIKLPQGPSISSPVRKFHKLTLATVKPETSQEVPLAQATHAEPLHTG